MINLKNKKAITLIALVITIVVLIILAAVAINLSLGNNGIFNRAKTAKEQYQNAQDYEQTEIANFSNNIEAYAISNRASESEINKIIQALNDIGIQTETNETIDSLCDKIKNIDRKKVTTFTINASASDYGTTYVFDISQKYENYKNITMDNISVQLYANSWRAMQQSDQCGKCTYTYSYNQATGQISIVLGGSGSKQTWSNPATNAKITIFE